MTNDHLIVDSMKFQDQKLRYDRFKYFGLCPFVERGETHDGKCGPGEREPRGRPLGRGPASGTSGS